MVSPNLLDVLRIKDGMSDKKPKKWIQKATDNAHGQFKAKAEAAGKSTREFAEEHKGSPGKLGKQARLALTLMGASHKSEKKSKSHSPKDARKALYNSKD